MNTKTLVMVTLVSSALHLQAQHPSPLDATAPSKVLDWNDPKWWEAMGQKGSSIKVGRSDFVVQGPLIDTLRYRSATPGKRSLRQKFFGLPFVNPLAPKSFSTPPERKDYFAWGEGNTAWSVLSDRPIPGPQSVLVSVSR